MSAAPGRQEYSRGVAEDWGTVLATRQPVQVPFGSLTGCLKTEDWSGLVSGGHEYKYYCPGVGMALETSLAGGNRVELIERLGP